ncbi:class I SAM-dependent methyltransferase [Nocardioides mangrovicus]|uniref:class I SAM-dependent methyltransferase n=1 Tax=Nocardioides mangrovicus TaxID=2478913 RepID=UPI0013140410|nr:class I SAM-dependent methyltransferase [Nocardioides mangrovicus]
MQPGRRLLDVGAGIGGPAAYAREETGVEVDLVDPMPQACAAAERIFGLPALVGDAGKLPLDDRGHDAAWSLGVLCTLSDQPAALAELARVVRSGGGIGLLVFVRLAQRQRVHMPDNDFPAWRELRDMLDDARLDLVHEHRLKDFGAPDAGWTARADRVHDDVRRHHLRDPRWQRAERQRKAVETFVDEGLVEGVVLTCRVR